MKTIAAILGSALLAAACSDKPPATPANYTTTTASYSPPTATAPENAPMPATQNAYSPDQDLSLGTTPAYAESQTDIDGMSTDAPTATMGTGPAPKSQATTSSAAQKGKSTPSTAAQAQPVAPAPAPAADTTPAPVQKADNTKQNARDRHDTLTPGDQGNSKDEVRITASIRKQLVASKLSFNAKNVKVITQGTKVTLRGPVKTDEEKAQVESFARGTNGVSDVDNQIEVKK